MSALFKKNNQRDSLGILFFRLHQSVRRSNEVSASMAAAERLFNAAALINLARENTMASCDPFSVNFSGSAQELFNKISALVHQHGGSISGGPSGGSFSVQVPVFGTVAGTYSVSGQTCTIHITQRSFFLACSLIESFVNSNIPTVVATAITAF